MNLPVCTYCKNGRCRIAGIDSGPCPSDPTCPMYSPRGVKKADWEQVRLKGEAIVLSDGVEISREDADEVEGYVMSGQLEGRFPITDGGPYDVILSKRSWENQKNVGGWLQGYICSCLWGSYHSGSSHDPGVWSGRLCSHGYALLISAGLRARNDFMNDRTAALGGQMYCAHCGKPIPYTPNCLCEECEERATFNHVVAHTFQDDELSLRWLELNAHDYVVEDIVNTAQFEEVGNGNVLASWKGRKAFITERD